MRMAARYAVLAAGALAAAALGAQPPSLQLPLACEPGADCWIANHVDLDPGPGARDYACGALTYNGHQGTDFALRDLEAMRAGVPVLAAAAGVVRGVRNRIGDANVREQGVDSVRDRECGNGVRIEHAGGWQTLYCHLRQGSVRVRPGEQVAAGQPLGLVGLSGLTEFPHLHFSVRRDGGVVDPFRGEAGEAGGAAAACGPGARPLWESGTLARLGYAPGAVYNVGVAPLLPPAAEVREGRHRERSLPRDAAVMAVWAELFGVAAGDALRLRVEGPDGHALLERRLVFERAQARAYRALGRQRRADAWPAGTYRVTIAVEKSGPQAAPPPTRFSFDVR